ncbi:hypothetical protein CBS470a_009899 [Colletotrichum nupharicola]|nr:hypothetical protein CBS470a_009899 [Colletotrichum nupharicola]
MADLLPYSNRSVVWAGVRKLEIRQQPIRVPNDDEVLVEVITTGICGSDCHNWDSAGVSRELILGHESAGLIKTIGKSVTDRFVGQRVAIEPGFSCRDGCGPLGLLILAVAKAYGVKKIVMFDNEESRTRFAESYGADVGIVTPRNSDPSQDVLSFSQHYAKEVITKYGLGYGFDVDLKPLITSSYPLTQANEAFEAQHARRDIKMVIFNQM